LKNKEQLNENNLLISLLKPFMTFWLTQWLGDLLINYGNLLQNDDRVIGKNIKKLFQTIYDNDVVVAKMNAVMADLGYDASVVDNWLQLPEWQKAIKSYDGVDGMDFQKFQQSVRDVLTKALKDNATTNRVSSKIKSKLK
jgi:hypothetical protein